MSGNFPVSVAERLATLEARDDAIMARLFSIETQSKSNGERLEQLIGGFKHQRGFIAGFAFAFTLLWGTLAAVSIYALRMALKGTPWGT